MWSDNESEVDFLGFSVHKDLIRDLVTDNGLLPLTVGIFGDWGGGKSSILRMLQRELEEKDRYSDVACLYFSGWTFEGYDDAKAALISSVLIQLGEHKRFGPKLRGRVVSLLKRVDGMRLLQLGVKHGVGPLVQIALGAGMTALGVDPHSAVAQLPVIAGALSAASALSANSSQIATGQTSGAANSSQAGGNKASDPEEESIDWLSLIKQDQTQSSVLDVRSFRRDFERLLADTNLRALVVLVDDLDRCMPDRLIENLEAIRLFLAVPKTAFVIAADERIVRNAVSMRYAASQLRAEQSADQEAYDLVTDYVEKLIQIPYHLPRLSPSEVETYMNLLFCQLHLAKENGFDTVLAACEAARKRNLYMTYGMGSIREALGGELPDALAQHLQWTATVAPAFTEGLKGNPRQVKRFLNALMLRKQLGSVAGLSIRDDVLVKLMLLEYAWPRLFDQLYRWQARAEGRPKEMSELEHGACADTAPLQERPSKADTSPGAPLVLWAERTAQEWLKLEPALTDIDLRDYFWVARDKLKAIASGLTMVSPIVRRLFESLLSLDTGERRMAARSALSIDQRELADLLHLLDQQLLRETDGRRGFDAMAELVDGGVGGATAALLTSLSGVHVTSVDPSVPFDLQRLITENKAAIGEVGPLLTNWSQTHTATGRAAQAVLADLDRTRGAKN